MNWPQQIFGPLTTRSKRLPIFSALALGLLALLLTAGAVPGRGSSIPQTVVTYYACVNNTTGAIIIVSKTTTCKTGYHKILVESNRPSRPNRPTRSTRRHWSGRPTRSTGASRRRWSSRPAGPTGPQGPQGPAGIAQGYSATGFNINLSSTPTAVASTNIIGTAGPYYINASILLYIDSADLGAFCFVAVASSPYSDGIYSGSSDVGHYQTASISDVLFVSAGDSIQLRCYSQGGDTNTFVYDAKLTATLIGNTFDNKPKTHSPGPPTLPKH